MSINGEHINKWKLPEHKPDPANWDVISNKLDAMTPMDSFTNSLESLPTHAPPAGLWNKIETGIVNPVPVSKPNIFNKYIISGVIIISAIIISVFIFLPKNNEEIITENNLNTENVASPVKPSISDSSQEFNVKENKTDDNVVKQQIREDENPTIPTGKHKSNNQSESGKLQINNEIVIHEGNQQIMKNKITNLTNITLSHNKIPGITGSSAYSNYFNKRNDLNFTIPDMYALPAPKFVTADYSYARQRTSSNMWHPIALSSNRMKISLKRFFAGLHISPELVFIENHEKEHLAWNYDFSLGYRLSNYNYLESGIGYSHSSCNERFEFDFLQNELIYKYTRVDSIIYEFDSINMELLRKYVVSDVDIYDSINYTDDYLTNSNNTFIQIPLMIGYKTDFKKMSIFVKAGTLLSVLLNSKQHNSFNEAEYRIVSLRQTKQCAIRTNWKMVLSAGVAINLHKKLSWAVEPQLRYYLNPGYKAVNGKSSRPYSISLRTGIYYNF